MPSFIMDTDKLKQVGFVLIGIIIAIVIYGFYNSILDIFHIESKDEKVGRIKAEKLIVDSINKDIVNNLIKDNNLSKVTYGIIADYHKDDKAIEYKKSEIKKKSTLEDVNKLHIKVVNKPNKKQDKLIAKDNINIHPPDKNDTYIVKLEPVIEVVESESYLTNDKVISEEVFNNIVEEIIYIEFNITEYENFGNTTINLITEMYEYTIKENL